MRVDINQNIEVQIPCRLATLEEPEIILEDSGTEQSFRIETNARDVRVRLMPAASDWSLAADTTQCEFGATAVPWLAGEDSLYYDWTGPFGDPSNYNVSVRATGGQAAEKKRPVTIKIRPVDDLPCGPADADADDQVIRRLNMLEIDTGITGDGHRFVRVDGEELVAPLDLHTDMASVVVGIRDDQSRAVEALTRLATGETRSWTWNNSAGWCHTKLIVTEGDCDVTLRVGDEEEVQISIRLIS